jgi:hypothetical protein
VDGHDIVNFITQNWGWISAIALPAMSGAGVLLNRRINRTSRKADAATSMAKGASDAVDAMQVALSEVRSELEAVKRAYGYWRLAVRAVVPERYDAVAERAEEYRRQEMERDRTQR